MTAHVAARQRTRAGLLAVVAIGLLSSGVCARVVCQPGWSHFPDLADLEGGESCVLLVTNVVAINALSSPLASFFKKATQFCSNQNPGAQLLSFASPQQASEFSMQAHLQGPRSLAPRHQVYHNEVQTTRTRAWGPSRSVSMPRRSPCYSLHVLVDVVCCETAQHRAEQRWTALAAGFHLCVMFLSCSDSAHLVHAQHAHHHTVNPCGRYTEQCGAEPGKWLGVARRRVGPGKHQRRRFLGRRPAQ
jgi:hypothetical protein